MLRAVNAEFWRGTRVFVTGHTGFKGSWLSLWLSSLGAEVKGYALAPYTEPSLYQLADIGSHLKSDIADVADFESLSQSLQSFDPDCIFHLAAQPLVKFSYENPIRTYETNVMGTVNLLEAARGCNALRAIVNVTTDKCYENREWVWGYRETEAMGGHDPYSNSKGCSELVTSAYRESFFRTSGDVGVATARAGNVIGGGDWSTDRLLPDILNAYDDKKELVIRYPDAIRPWQHVLEPLAGYLILAELLCKDRKSYAEAWNFGPYDQDVKSVKWIVEYMATQFNNGLTWRVEDNIQHHEATLLKLDISKANARLGWKPKWSIDKALDLIVDFHQAWKTGEDLKSKMLHQIALYNS